MVSQMEENLLFKKKRNLFRIDTNSLIYYDDILYLFKISENNKIKIRL